MDCCEVPECLGLVAGIGRDDDEWPRALDEYYFTNELLELLRHGGHDGAGSSAAHGSVNEKPLLSLPQPRPPSPLPTNSASDQLAQSSASPRAVAGDADMASWLCQVFEEASNHEPRRPATTTTAKTGGSTARSGSGSGHRRAAAAGASTDGVAAGGDTNKAESCSGRRHRTISGGRRSCSGRDADQRRRNNINNKMRTLQQLVPRCSKTDKASTLEEVIKYVKLLQHQVLSNRYATPTTILPLSVVPPPCMQPAGDVFSGQPAMLPQYPFIPAVFACPHHGNGMPPPPSLPYRHLAVSDMQQFVHCHPVPNDPRRAKPQESRSPRN